MRIIAIILFLIGLPLRAAVPTFESFSDQFQTNSLRVYYRGVHTNDNGIIYPSLANNLSLVTNENIYGTFSLPAKVMLLTLGTNYLDVATNTTWLLNSPTNDATQVIISLSAGAYQGQLLFVTSQNGSNAFTLPDLSEQWDVPGAYVDIQGDWIGTTNRGMILQYTAPDWIEMARFDPGGTGGGTVFGTGTAPFVPYWISSTTLSNSPMQVLSPTSLGVITISSGSAIALGNGLVSAQKDNLGIINPMASSGFFANNTFLATSANQQNSPGIAWAGQGFGTNTATSQAVTFGSFVIPAAGLDKPTGLLAFYGAISNTASPVRVFGIASDSLYPNDATMYFDGTGHYSTPTAGSVSATNAYNQVQDEGGNLAQRTTLNFAGAGVTASDSGGVTLVTIPGGIGTTINPSDDFVPYRINATSFGDSNLKRISDNEWRSFGATGRKITQAIGGTGILTFERFLIGNAAVDPLIGLSFVGNLVSTPVSINDDGVNPPLATHIVYIGGDTAARTITNTPSISSAYEINGIHSIFIGKSDVNTVTFQDQSVLPGSHLALKSPTRTLGSNDVLELVFLSVVTNWVEIGFHTATAGGSTLWASAGGVLSPSPAVDVVSIISQLADNATNVALVVDTAVPWNDPASVLVRFDNAQVTRRLYRADDSTVSGFGYSLDFDPATVGWFPDGMHISVISSNGPASFQGETVIIDNENYEHTLYVDEQSGLVNPADETVVFNNTLDGTGTNNTRFLRQEQATIDPLGNIGSPGVINRTVWSATGTNAAYNSIQVKATDTVQGNTGLVFSKPSEFAWLKPFTLSTGSATAFLFDTSNVLTNGDSLVTFKNSGVQMANVNNLGAVTVGSVTKAQKTAMTPADGMLVYQTDNTPGFRGYINGTWFILSTAADP